MTLLSAGPRIQSPSNSLKTADVVDSHRVTHEFYDVVAQPPFIFSAMCAEEPSSGF